MDQLNLQQLLQQQQMTFYQTQLLVPSLLMSLTLPQDLRYSANDPILTGLPASGHNGPRGLRQKKSATGTGNNDSSTETPGTSTTKEGLVDYIMANQLAIAQLAQVVTGLLGPDHQVWSKNNNVTPVPVDPYTAQPGQFPWAVSIKLSNFDKASYHLCGGVLISTGWVLTSSSCVTGEWASDLLVVAGDLDFNKQEGTEQNLKVTNIIKNSRYVYWEMPYKNDVALLQLETPITITEAVNTMPLPPPNVTVTGKCREAGWGVPDEGVASLRILKYTDVSYVEVEDCKEEYPNLDEETSVCAGKDGYGACSGDRGAALVCETTKGNVMVGLMSWREGCALPDKPAVYMHVEKYLTWIRDTADI